MKMKRITSAELIKYNANTSGSLTTDCVKRSISFAFDAPYSEVGKLLNQEMKAQRKDTWKIRSVYDKVINKLAGGASVSYTIVPYEDRVKLSEFVDNQIDSSIVYLVQTGTKRTSSNHLVCVRNGKVWDSWDSRNEWVISYYTIGGYASKQVTDIKDHLEEFGTYIIKDLVNNEIVKYANKRNWQLGPIDIDIVIKDYQIKALAGIMIKPNELVDKKRYYDIEVPFVMNPTLTVDEAKALIQKVGKTKVYDRMYAINEQEKKLADEYVVLKQLRESGKEGRNHLFLNSQESKFFHSLPGWVRPLITSLSIQEPGQFSDSYSISMIPLPTDNREYDKFRLDFEAYDASQMRDMLDRYKNNGEVPFVDYYPADEY